MAREEYYTLKLGLGARGRMHDSVQCALNAYLVDSGIREDYRYPNCMACEESLFGVAQQQRITILPEVLLIQLKRWSGTRLLKQPVHLNATISFGGATYTLQAVVFHIGPQANDGHYVAHVRSRIHNSWLRYDDEHLVPIRSQSVNEGYETDFKSYLLFYGKDLDRPLISASSSLAL